MNNVHIYQNRHIFVGDEHAGKYNSLNKGIYVREEFAAHLEAITSFFRRRLGIFPKAVIGAEPLECARPLIDFPDHIKELKDPTLGDLTPSLITWARENLPREDFVRRYGLEMPYEQGTDQGAAETQAQGITADGIGGPLDEDEDDSVPALIAEGNANFPQGQGDSEDDDYTDSETLKDLKSDPPSDEIPAFERVGDLINQDGAPVAQFYGEQLRMKHGYAALRPAVEAFLASQQ